MKPEIPVTSEFTCLSCEHYHSSGCQINEPFFPFGNKCKQFVYEPGVDE